MLYEGEHARSPRTGTARAHDHARRLLQDLRDDRLAARLRGRAEGAGRAAHAPGHQLHSCTPPSTQLAGVAALEGPQDDVRAMIAEFRARRELIVAGLNALPGVTCVVPHGAFYAFPNVTGTGLDRRATSPTSCSTRRASRLAGHGVRRVRRGLPAPLVRELAREHRGRPGADAARFSSARPRRHSGSWSRAGSPSRRSTCCAGRRVSGAPHDRR